METNPKEYTFDRVVRLVLSAAVLVGLFFLLRHLSDVLIPFAAAVVLAYLINPLVTVFQRKTRHRGLAVGLTLGGLVIFSLGVCALLVPLAASQFERFRNDLAELRADFVASVKTINATAQGLSEDQPKPPPPNADPDQPDKAAGKSVLGWDELKSGWTRFRQDADAKPRSIRIAELREAIAGTYLASLVDDAVRFAESEEFRQLLLRVGRRLAVGGWEVVSFALNLVLGLTGLVIVLIYLVFLLLDFPEYARTWPMLLPPTYRETTVEFFEQFTQAMRRYFRGQSLVALFTAMWFSIGFTLIGLPMAVPFGLFVGLLNMVPYLQVVAIIPAFFLAALRAVEADASLAGSIGLVLLVFAVVQVIQDGFVTPRVMGQATGLRPIAILLGVFVWGKLLGFLGVLLAIPLTCLGIAYYRRFVLRLGATAATS